MKYEVLKDDLDVKKIQKKEDLEKLCKEIRQKIVEIVSKNGGHLASNLGVVELTVALHRVFTTPEDKIIWDVGHQCYAHKILTNRLKDFDTIRTENGLSGFTNRSESKHDVFTSGHSSVAVSQALGILQSNLILKRKQSKVIAVLGDGALTGGLAYEGLNNAGQLKKNFIVILNDNKMSISKNVGAIANYLANLRTRSYYINFKNFTENFLKKIPLIGNPINNFIIKSKLAIKNILFNSTIFENLGFTYYGPIDGHDIEKIESVLQVAKNINKPVLIHVITKKGKNYSFAEKNPSNFHGISKFEISSGKVNDKKDDFSKIFGNEICKLAEKDQKICCITAAMATGTGLVKFRDNFPKRFFDVGIAESHAITFAAGLSSGGFKPVVAIYSSFLQRGYDQIIHDVSLQKLNMIFAVDRCGLIGEDGETHQGLFDVGFFNTVPNVTIFVPSFFDELRFCIAQAIQKDAITVVRYPRGGEFEKPKNFIVTGHSYDFYYTNEKGNNSKNCLIITYGRIFSNAYLAQKKLKSAGISVTILKLNIIKPIPTDAILKSLNFEQIFFFEESLKSGGIAEKFAAELLSKGFRGKYFITAIPDEFVKHATVISQLKKYKLDSDSIFNIIIEKLRKILN